MVGCSLIAKEKKSSWQNGWRFFDSQLFLTGPTLLEIQSVPFFLVQWHNCKESRNLVCLLSPQKHDNFHIYVLSSLFSILISFFRYIFPFRSHANFSLEFTPLLRNWKLRLIGVPVLWNREGKRNTAKCLRTFLCFERKCLFYVHPCRKVSF
jgi:hypothetical protein